MTCQTRQGQPSARLFGTAIHAVLLGFASGITLNSSNPPVGGREQRLLGTRLWGHEMFPLWKRAARLLNTTIPDERGHMFLDIFYSQMFFWSNSYKFPASRLQYVPIWKAANNAIRCNLKQAQNTTAFLDLQAAAEVDTELVEPNQFSFTVVREPLTRFVSGVSEINLRGNCPSEMHLTYTSYPRGSAKRAVAFVQDLLSTRMKAKCRRNWHIFSMLGPMSDQVQRSGKAIDWVGKLERMDRVWRRLGREAGHTMPEFNETCGTHPLSSNDDYAPRRAMEDAVELEDSNDDDGNALESTLYTADIRNALVCAVLLPDYLCLDYKLPALASDCVAAGFAPSEERWVVIEKNIRRKMCPKIKELD